MWKAIKPKRLQDKTFRLAMLQAMTSAGQQCVREYRKTTATWNHRVDFKPLLSLRGGILEMVVATDDKVWNYVNQGTRPHLIWAGQYTGKSKARNLKFQETYYPKTIPGVVGSVRGGSFGRWIYRPYVQHPGTAPRHFDRAIMTAFQPRYKRIVEKAMSDWARESGQHVSR